MKTLDMEIALAQNFNFLTHMIISNVSYGMFRHECDLIILTQAGYAWEVEIKVSKADLIKDKAKKHGHKDSKISRLYFAIPTKLMPLIGHIPEHAGIIEVKSDRIGSSSFNGNTEYYQQCVHHRPPTGANTYKFSIEEQLKLARLGTIRIWSLKKKIRKLTKIAKEA